MHSWFSKLTMLILVAAGSIFAGNLSIRDVRSWGQWQAQVTSVQCTTTVTGLIARTVLTLQFKDTISTATSDSLEMAATFNLPQGSIVDSMYLWIGDKPIHAILKSIWSASQIYWSIVGVRRDPALLTKGWVGDNYTLRIFPFARREQRTVRICYNTPLSVDGGRLACTLPTDLTGLSAFPTGRVTVSVKWMSCPSDSVTIDQASSLESSTTRNGDGSINVIMSDINVKSMPAARISIPMNDGVMVNFGESVNNEMHFTALLDPGSMFNLEKNRKKKIVLLWNNVYGYQQWNNTTQSYQTTNYYYYNKTYYDQDKSSITDFVRTQLRSDDSIALFFNDGEQKKYGNALEPVTPSTANLIQSFITNNLSTVSRNQGCLDPITFLSQCLENYSSKDSIDFIIIDKYSSYYSYNSADSLLFADLSGKLNRQIPPGSKFYGIMQGGSSVTNQLYQILINNTGGIVIPSSYYSSLLSDAFKGIIPYLSARFYPANLSISCIGSGYPYDVIMPQDERYYSRAPVLITGKMYNSDNIRLTFSGVVDGKEYHYDKVFYSKNFLTPGNALSTVWAQKKTDRLLGTNYWYDTPGRKEALNLSLYYRILTPVTALLALEPGMIDSSKYFDDVVDPSSIPGTPVKSKQKTTKVKQPSMAVIYSGGALTITFEGISEYLKGRNYSLTVYDMQGRVIADLTANLQKSKKSVFWKIPRIFGSGMYIVKFKSGRTVLSKSIFISR